MEITNTSFLGKKHFPASYLGDGAYAVFDGFGIWLCANSHEAPTDKVFLEPQVFEALVRFNKECRDKEVIKLCQSRNEHLESGEGKL